MEGVFEGETFTEDDIVFKGGTNLSGVLVTLERGVFVKMAFPVGTGVFVENRGLIIPSVSSGVDVPAGLIVFTEDWIVAGFPVGESDSVFEIITDS